MSTSPQLRRQPRILKKEICRKKYRQYTSDTAVERRKVLTLNNINRSLSQATYGKLASMSIEANVNCVLKVGRWRNNKLVTWLVHLTNCQQTYVMSDKVPTYFCTAQLAFSLNIYMNASNNNETKKLQTSNYKSILQQCKP